jgi:hypothetical protein
VFNLQLDRFAASNDKRKLYSIFCHCQIGDVGFAECGTQAELSIVQIVRVDTIRKIAEFRRK